MNKERILEWQNQAVRVTYKKIRNVYLRVDEKGIRISAPMKTSKKRLMLFLQEKRNWIARRCREVEKERETEERRLSGEAGMMLWGETYTVGWYPCTGKGEVRLQGNEIMLFCPAQTPADTRKKLVEGWYGGQVKQLGEEYVRHWERVLGVRAKEVRVRRMKTRWGTCAVEKSRIWFNTALGRYSRECLEYVAVHELCHLAEPNHGKGFYALLEKHLPDWKERRALLRKKEGCCN